MKKTARYILLFATLFSLASCGSYSVEDFKPITNVTLSADHSFYADMDSVIIEGIQAPTKKQTANGMFNFTFNVSGAKKLYYKIYFQNEDYKFPEFVNDTLNTICNENFYGSWGNGAEGFKEITEGTESVSDFFRIAGNPRSERKFWGENMNKYKIEDAEVADLINNIKSQPEWFKAVQDKAVLNNMPIEQQLELDAIFTLCYVRDKGRTDHKWKRNPRMGKYSTMLVVCTEEDLDKIPDYIQDITHTNNDKYVNPYYYFLYGEGKKLSHTKVLLDTNTIKLKSKIDVTKGIFINKAEQQNYQEYSYLNGDCNNNMEKFRTAHIEQFFHAEVRDFKMNSIPLIANVLANEYTKEDYKRAETFYKEEQMVKDYIRSSNCPCKTVSVNKQDKYIEIFNPKSVDIKNARKENVGIKTRIGYTYGKFTAKVKFPPQINATNVWTGLTNAFWMLFQDKQLWNHRRASKTGYAQKGIYSPDAPRTPTTYYSEIDFEMVKTSKYWPEGVYEKGKAPVEDAQNNDDVIVTTTNFDLSSKDPVRFGKGFCPTKYDNQEFLPFRWEPWHQAITIRTPVKNSDLYNPPFYYYQIEWKPTEIIWRIGSSKDNMKVIGYMNDEITMIPNNQMIMIITQEYHLTDWWPPMPFKQEYIPFLKDDLKGKIYEFEIE